jgi:hypothetical protein
MSKTNPALDSKTSGISVKAEHNKKVKKEDSTILWQQKVGRNNL